MTPRFRNMSNIKNSNSTKEFEYLSNRFNFDLKENYFICYLLVMTKLLPKQLYYIKFNALAYAIIKTSKRIITIFNMI